MRKAVCDTADLKQRLIETWLNISTNCHGQSHWQVGATTTSLCQSKGMSLQALTATNRLFSEPPTFYRSFVANFVRFSAV